MALLMNMKNCTNPAATMARVMYHRMVPRAPWRWWIWRFSLEQRQMERSKTEPRKLVNR